MPYKQEALIPKLMRGEKYILFYTNDDYSDLYVSEKYKPVNNAGVKVCWLVELNCNKTTCGSNIVFQSQALTEREFKECYKL